MILHNKIALYDSMGTLLDIHEIQKRLKNHRALYFRINYKKHHEFKSVPFVCSTIEDVLFYALGCVEYLHADIVMTDYLW